MPCLSSLVSRLSHLVSRISYLASRISHLVSRISSLLTPHSSLLTRLSLLLFILLAFALRLYTLTAKGLSYDEAATALMARATPGAIISFHWRAAFEHPPVWQLLMHGWSLLAGQSEFALRYLPVLAGTLLIPLLYQLARRLSPAHSPFPPSPFNIHHLPFTIHYSLLALTACAPILIYYSQEARMYALVVTTAVAATLALLHMLSGIGTRAAVPRRSPTAAATVVIALHWFMLGLHYYTLLFVVAEGLFCLIWLVTMRANRRQWRIVSTTLGLAVTPLLLWLTFAPGFHDTLRITLAGSGAQRATASFLTAFWRELSFAAVRWEVAQSVWGYLWLPLIGVGMVAVVAATWHDRRAVQTIGHPRAELRKALLPLLLALLPLALSALLFPNLATRYLLYVMPFLLLLMAWGIDWLGRWHWLLVALGLAMAFTVPALALPHYFGAYQKSGYRDMAVYLQSVRTSDEAILLEGPRQHLLAKYYLPPDWPIFSAPAIDLPPFWPVNAPPVVPEEMDDVIQQLLHDVHGIWLILTAEDEVDRGEFVPKYLTAVAFETDCAAWRDVRLCHYLSPQAFAVDMTTDSATLFADALRLQRADLTLPANAPAAPLLVTLHWQAEQVPQADYRVTLRLLDTNGAIVSQRDNYPIGPLLPPTTWQAGNEKPGYMALPLPAALSPGTYQVTVNLYNPNDGAAVPHRVPTTETDSSAPLILAILTIDDTITLRAP